MPVYDPTKNPFATEPNTLGAHGSKGRAVTPSNSVDLDPYAKSLFVITGGTISFVPVGNADDAPIALTVPNLWVCPYQVRRVNATGTAATGIWTID